MLGSLHSSMLSHVSPVKPGRHWHPRTGSQPAPPTPQSQWWVQFVPYVPLGHTETKAWMNSESCYYKCSTTYYTVIQNYISHLGVFAHFLFFLGRHVCLPRHCLRSPSRIFPDGQEHTGFSSTMVQLSEQLKLKQSTSPKTIQANNWPFNQSQSPAAAYIKLTEHL
jgi:hypothetical protein